jgi:hypothetical protein
MSKDISMYIVRAPDGTIPSAVEPALALGLSVPNWADLLPYGRNSFEIIRKYRSAQESNN